MQQFKNIQKRVLRKDYMLQLVKGQAVKQGRLESKNEKENNCMDSSSNTLGRSHSIWSEHGWEKVTMKEKMNLF